MPRSVPFGVERDCGREATERVTSPPPFPPKSTHDFLRVWVRVRVRSLSCYNGWKENHKSGQQWQRRQPTTPYHSPTACFLARMLPRLPRSARISTPFGPSRLASRPSDRSRPFYSESECVQLQIMVRSLKFQWRWEMTLRP